MLRVSNLLVEDSVQAAELHQAAFYRGWSETDFDAFLKDPFVFGLKIQKEDILCGYILCREVGGEADILTLVVAPRFQRKGMGNHLLNVLIKRLTIHHVSKLFLEVAEDNEAAKEFYIKNGFVLLRKIPNYYGRPGGHYVNGLSFVKQL